jgi:hypothetical protein
VPESKVKFVNKAALEGVHLTTYVDTPPAKVKGTPKTESKGKSSHKSIRPAV